MKKIFILAILVCLVSAFAFAMDFTVDKVTGRVDCAGKAVKVGDVLAGDAALRTNIGAQVVLVGADGSTFTIPAGRNGKIEDLIKTSSPVVSGGVTRTNTETASSVTRQASTASSRASDQAGDADIAAE